MLPVRIDKLGRQTEIDQMYALFLRPLLLPLLLLLLVHLRQRITLQLLPVRFLGRCLQLLIP